MKLVVREVCFAYNSRPVLQGVTLEVGAREVLGLVGPNGSGKSTLLKCLARVLKPRRGIVYLDGREIAAIDTRDLARKMGYVPQAAGTTFPFTVLEAVLVGRKPHVRWEVGSRDLEVVGEALRSLSLEDMAHRYLDELSGGERQKVFLARALAQEPEVLLLDEPINSLDILHQLEVLELVRELAARRDIAVVMVLHDLNLAARFSDKLVMLKDGKIFAAGRPGEVLTPENVSLVYGVEVHVSKGEFGLSVFPLRPAKGQQYGAVVS